MDRAEQKRTTAIYDERWAKFDRLIKQTILDFIRTQGPLRFRIMRRCLEGALDDLLITGLEEFTWERFCPGDVESPPVEP